MVTSETKFFIYALLDPDKRIIRYIGKTNDCYKRKQEHNTRPGKTKKDKWIEDLKKKGKAPIFQILEECNEGNWHKREMFYIKKHNTKGNRLLNSYIGIKKRTDNDLRLKVSEILSHGVFYFYEFSERFPKELVIKLQNGIYWRVYGNDLRLPGYYFYVYSSDKRYFISKASSIYKTNLKDIQTIKDKIKIIKGSTEDIVDSTKLS